MSEKSPAFSPVTVAALVLTGGLVLLLMLVLMGAGLGLGEMNDGGAHAGGKGLNGYAGLSRLYAAAGYEVDLARDEQMRNRPGLLVLTPPHRTDADELSRIVWRHRQEGPVMVITPKWFALGTSSQQPGMRRGWVRLDGTGLPEWKGFLDDVSVMLVKGRVAQDAAGHQLKLPYPNQILAGSGRKLVPLVRDDQGHILAARYDDSAGEDEDETEADLAPRYPLVLVFEPDLANNAGLNQEAAAQIMISLADGLLAQAPEGPARRIGFDVTLNGFARKSGLLTLAFTPPYLAATLALVLAALACLWRALARFGPPLAQERALALGKGALVVSMARLIARAGRVSMLTQPYAQGVRGRLVGALGLPAGAGVEAHDAAIDRALRARRDDGVSYSSVQAQLRAATKLADILRAARQLHAIERILTR